LGLSTYPNETVDIRNNDGYWVTLNVGFDRYAAYADGKGGIYEVYDSHFFPTEYLDTIDSLNYFGDGEGGYYTYPIADIYSGNGSNPVIINVGCGDFVIGQSNYDVFTDGTGGYYNVETGSSWLPIDTYVGSCNSYDYFSDGDVSAYTVYHPPCPAAGTFNSDAPDTYVEVPMGSAQTYFDGNDNIYLNDGNCGTYIAFSGLYGSGTFITNYGDYNYYWDGSGGYYQGEHTGPQCEDSTLHTSGQEGWSYDGCHWSYDDRWYYPAAGTFLGHSSGPAYYNDGYREVLVGSVEYDVFADGNNGSYSANESYAWTPGGELIEIYMGYGYYSNGSGGYNAYQCQMSGYEIGSSSEPNYYSTDCGNWEIGQNIFGQYADGNCGSYNEGRGTNWNSSSTYDCNNTRYSHDGFGNVTTSPICDQSGNFVGSSMDSVYYNAGCGDWYVGSVNWQEYTDGYCGTYKNYDTPSYDGPGSYLGECNNWNYYTDGNGGAYSY
jgi:hypothetical protein